MIFAVMRCGQRMLVNDDNTYCYHYNGAFSEFGQNLLDEYMDTFLDDKIKLETAGNKNGVMHNIRANTANRRFIAFQSNVRRRQAHMRLIRNYLRACNG